MRLRKLAGLSSGALVMGALAVPALMAPAHAAPVTSPISLNCAFGGNAFDYDTQVELAAQATGAGTVDLTANLGDMPNTAPPFVSLPGQEFVATLGTNLGDLTGTRTGDFQGGVAVEIPQMTGGVAGTAGTLVVTVEDFSLDVGESASIPCTLASPVVMNVPVAAAPVPAAVKTTSKATVKDAKKKATIKIKVSAASGTPSGKVKFVVKLGKKKVVTKAVNLNRLGVAKLVVKKAKLKKGKYKVAAQYAGTKAFKKSKTTGAFKVK